MTLTKIISGGQTGIDRMAIEVGKEQGYQTGGTAPKNFMTENGPDYSLKEFGLVESHSDKYPVRTAQNIKDSDGTVWYGDIKSRGGILTEKLAKGKPFIINPTPSAFAHFIVDNKISIVNVAGNRGSKLTATALAGYEVAFTHSLWHLEKFIDPPVND